MTTPGGLTGAPRRLLTLASGIRDYGIEVCIASQSDSDLLRAAQVEGHEIAVVDATGVLALRRGALFGGGFWFRFRVLLALLRQNFRLFHCIWRRHGDVVWTRGSKGIAFAALGALLSRRPLVWDVDYELPSTGLVRWLHRAGLWASRLIVFQYRAAPDAIFGEALSNRYRDKFRTIVPGIDVESLESLRLRREDRKVFGDEPFVIIQVATICERKNQRLLLEVVKALDLSSAPREFRVQLVGNTFDEKYTTELHNELLLSGLETVVEFLGWRDDVQELMVDSDLLIMPSRDEGVPNTVQEAMYIGIPVLVSDVAGMPEIVEHNETGWVLSSSDPAVWAEQIRTCMRDSNLRERVGDAASVYARKTFNADEWARRYANAIYQAIGSRRKGTLTNSA